MAILSALELKDFRLERRRTGCPSSAYLEAMSRSARSSLEKHPRTAHLPAALGPLLGSPILSAHGPDGRQGTAHPPGVRRLHNWGRDLWMKQPPVSGKSPLRFPRDFPRHHGWRCLLCRVPVGTLGIKAASCPWQAATAALLHQNPAP